MLEKCKNTMTYSYIEYESPLSQHDAGGGAFLCFRASYSAIVLQVSAVLQRFQGVLFCIGLVPIQRFDWLYLHRRSLFAGPFGRNSDTDTCCNAFS